MFTNLRFLRGEEIVTECIKSAKVLNDQAESESFLAFQTLAFEIGTIEAQMEI